MNTTIYEQLEGLGIEKKPAKVYLAALEMGGGSASSIAQKAGIERVNTYYILEQLTHEGLVYSAQKEGKTIFAAISPRKLESKAKTRLEEIRQILPELLSIENSNKTKPTVRFYEGIEGIKQIFDETLDLPSGTETLAYSSAEAIHDYLKEFVPVYLKRRVEAGITQRAIAEDSEEAREHQKNDQAELRQTVLVDKENFPFTNEINIFGNKIMIASYRDLMGVIIESESITKTQRAIFELAWKGAKQVAHEENKIKDQPETRSA